MNFAEGIERLPDRISNLRPLFPSPLQFYDDMVMISRLRLSGGNFRIFHSDSIKENGGGMSSLSPEFHGKQRLSETQIPPYPSADGTGGLPEHNFLRLELHPAKNLRDHGVIGGNGVHLLLAGTIRRDAHIDGLAAGGLRDLKHPPFAFNQRKQSILHRQETQKPPVEPLGRRTVESELIAIRIKDSIAAGKHGTPYRWVRFSK